MKCVAGEEVPASVADKWLMLVCICSLDSHWLAVLPSGEAAPRVRPPLDAGRSPEYSSMTLCRQQYRTQASGPFSSLVIDDILLYSLSISRPKPYAFA